MSMACAGERVVGRRDGNQNSNSSGHSWLLSTKSSNQSNLQLQRSQDVSRITIQLTISYTRHPTKYVSQGKASRVCRLRLILLGSRNWSGLGKQPHLSSHLTYLSKGNAIPCSCASEDTDIAFGPPPSLSMCPFLPCQLLVSVSIQKPPLEGAAGHCWASLRQQYPPGRCLSSASFIQIRWTQGKWTMFTTRSYSCIPCWRACLMRQGHAACGVLMKG